MLKRLVFYLRIYIRLQAYYWRATLEYEADFWIGIVGMGLTHTAGFVFVWAFFTNVPTVVGWSLWDTAFLYGLSVIPRGLGELLCDGAWSLSRLINRGELDRLLVRPISPMLQLLTQMSSIHGLGNILVGSVILVRAAHELQMEWEAKKVFLLALTLIDAMILITAISVITNAVAFWEPAVTTRFPNFIYNFQDLTKFPLTVYDQLVQVLLTWVVPFALVSYYPGLILLDKPGVNRWLGYTSPLACILLCSLAGLLWYRGLERYQGTGY